MQEPLTDLRPGPEGGPEPDDEAFQQVRERVQALITAARGLSDTCADLADALRPVPGHAPDDPLVAAFGRLRAERTAALLDEAASAARGTLGLLHSAYGALDRPAGPPVPRSGATTWPDAFVEVPARAFTVEDEVGTAVGVRAPWGVPAGSVAGEGGLRADVTGLPVDADGGDGLRAFAGEPAADALEPGLDAPAEDATAATDGPEAPADDPETPTADPVTGLRGPAPVDPDTALTGPNPADPVTGLRGPAPADPDTALTGPNPADPVTGLHGPAPADPDTALTGPNPADPVTGLHGPALAEPVTEADPARPEAAAPDDGPLIGDELAALLGGIAPRDATGAAPVGPFADRPWETADPGVDGVAGAGIREGDLDAAGFGPEDVDGEGLRSWATVPVRSDAAPDEEPERPDGTSVEDTDADDPARITSAALAGWIVVDPDDADDPGRPIRPGTATTPTPGTPTIDAPVAGPPASEGPAAGSAPAGTPTAGDSTVGGLTAGPTTAGDPTVGAPTVGAPVGGSAAGGPVHAATSTLDRLDVPIDTLGPDDADAPAAEPAADDAPGYRPGFGADPADGDARTSRPGLGAEPADSDARTSRPGLGADPADGDARTSRPGLGADPADGDARALRPVLGAVPDDAGSRPAADPVGGPGADTEPARPDEGPGWHGDTVSAEPRSLSLVPPVPEGPDTIPPTWPDHRTPDHRTPGHRTPDDRTPDPRTPGRTPDPWAPRAADPWQDDPMGGADLSGAATFARLQRPVWAAEPAPGSSAAGDGVAVFPIGAPIPAPEPTPAEPLDEPAAAVIARQVEGARRHLQAALVVANGPGAPARLGALLTAVEQVLTAVTDLARETRGLLESGLADRTFPGEARFLCCPPWDGTQLVGRDAYGDDVASPAGLAKLLRALGYEAHSVTSAGGVAGVQVRGDRYAMQVALVEPAGGGRQRWSGALEWADATGTSRTWAETLGPVELEDEELARRVDELLRRSLGG